MVRIALSLAALLLVACDEPPTEDAGSPATDAGPASTLPATIGPAERPARLVASSSHDASAPAPAVILLHGYGVDGGTQAEYFNIELEIRRRGWLLVLPDGTLDVSGRRFWAATDACCDLGEMMIDDVTYLDGLLDELEGLAAVSDVFFMGHSNGGFMSYRMACERSERISAIATLAGSDYPNDVDCVPDRAVSVLHMHGTADATIPYDGGMINGASFPPATEVVERWAGRAGCDVTMPTMGPAQDFVTDVAGAETRVLSYETGCADAEVALWTIEDGIHIPPLSRSFTPSVLDWLEAHAR